MSSLKENQIKESLKELIPTGNSMVVLKKFEDRYKFSRYDDLVYFITTELEKVKSFDDRIKVKFGRSDGSFERRWSAYCHHSISSMPFIIAVITIPPMPNYKLFYPDTEIENIPNVYNEEKNLKKIYKDRTYKEGSTENIMISMNEICDYFEKRQLEINKMYDEYSIDYNMWLIPFTGDDGKIYDRIKYHTELDKLEANTDSRKKKCIKCDGTGQFYQRGTRATRSRPIFEKCSYCNGEGKYVDTDYEKNCQILALKKSFTGEIDEEIKKGVTK
jgi:hypothetical protein|tara:strand:- start:39 stop:860 length:822 start_codon:yes stop_codon:yes gene_type:complete